MNVVIVGGNLQGVETAYLARKSGWLVTVIDRRPDAPASGICDRYVHSDLLHDQDWQKELQTADIVFPAVENQAVLDVLAAHSTKKGIPFAFDPKAYRITASKILTNRLLQRIGTTMPALWPNCRTPVVVKPSSGSGSEGVRIIDERRSVSELACSPGFSERFVCQEYVVGPSFSIEVVGRPGEYAALQVTDLFMDESYDCRRVTAPTGLTVKQVALFREESVRMAEALALRGVMDVEAILHDGCLKVLELDARMPSQTPTVVYHSSGLNILERTASVFLSSSSSVVEISSVPKAVIYEHVRVDDGRMIFAGEHLMSQCGPVEVVAGFFGADEAVTNFAGHRERWSATLIFTGEDRCEVQARRNGAVEHIIEANGVTEIIDSHPARDHWGGGL